MNANNNTATVQIKDFANKNQIFVFRKADMQPLGIIHCFGATEWKALDAEGIFIDWFPSKKAAVASIA